MEKLNSWYFNLIEFKDLSKHSKQNGKPYSVKKVLAPYFKRVFFFTGILWVLLFFLHYNQELHFLTIKIRLIKFFISSEVQHTEFVIPGMQDFLALHSFAIASSCWFLLGLYFISNSKKFY